MTENSTHSLASGPGAQAVTDIVERLRDGPVPIRVCNEAADEIERLRADIAQLSFTLNGLANRSDFADKVLDARRKVLEADRRALEQKP